MNVTEFALGTKSLARGVRLACFRAWCCLAAGFSLTSIADPFCFSMAESFYEQVYCEVIARGAGGSLPPLHEFQQSNARTQFLLLKRPAEKIGVVLTAPVSTAKAASGPVTSTPVRPKEEGGSREETHSGLAGCQIAGVEIHCGSQRFRLLGNRRNAVLEAGVLGGENRMAIGNFAGNPSDHGALNRYLISSYTRYLDRMMAIGLAGSTMTLSRFERLYYDMRDMGVDFAARMETLYGYLKQDKGRIGVSEKIVAPDLMMSSCQPLSTEFIACGAGVKNYVFVAASGNVPERSDITLKEY